MKKIWKLLLLTAMTVALWSCQEKEKEDFYLNIKDENGAVLSGVQNFVYKEFKEFPFESNSLSKATVDVPTGWSARLDYATHKFVVTAPAGSDQSAAQSGTIKVTATSNGGATLDISITVAVTDATISFKLLSDQTEYVLKFGETVTIPAEVSNVSTINYVAPKGWTLTYDSDKAIISMTAPSKSTEGAEYEGSVKITPMSERGNSGSPVEFKVAISYSVPSVQLEKDALEGLLLDTSTEIKSTEIANVVKIEEVSAPSGWTSSVSLSSNGATITIKTPKAGDGQSVGEGEFVFRATSETEETSEFTIKVSMKGINNAAQFKRFAKAWSAQSEELENYKQDGNFVINSNIDLSDTTVRMWVFKDFTGVFDGNNHSLKVSLLGGKTIGGENGNTAIFNTVKGTVKNIILEGKAMADQSCNLSGLTCWSDGGRYENITTYIELEKKGTGNDRTDTYMGGIVSDETNSANGGGKYINCTNKGKFISSGHARFIGGLVADVWDNPGMTMENCTNEADIVVTVSSEIKDMGTWWLGGLVGKADGSGAIVTGCSNKGNITVDFGSINSTSKGIGGLYGAFSGTFSNCFNEGKIVVSSTGSFGLSIVGGLIGYVCYAKNFGFKASNCVNRGSISAIASDAGGLLGKIEKCTEESISINSCNNEARVECITSTKPSCQAIGGLIGTAYNHVKLNSCKNTGVVAGFPSIGAAGLIGRAADNIVIDGCENSGKVAVGGSSGVSSPYPMAAGLVVGVYKTIKITGSKNTGAVSAMISVDGAANKVFTSQIVLEGGEDPSTVDEATEKASASTVVTTTKEWSSTIPSSWM